MNEKVKECCTLPLFKSYDGVDVFYGDNVFKIGEAGVKCGYDLIVDEGFMDGMQYYPTSKYFSTKAKAMQYEKENPTT